MLAPLSHGIGHVEPWISLFGALYALGYLADRARRLGTRVTTWLDGDDPEPRFADPRIGAVWDRHWRGELTLAETEAELETLLDEPQRELRETVEAIDGIGPRTSAALAAEFETLGALGAASSEEIQRVEGVGEHTAERLQEGVAYEGPTT